MNKALKDLLREKRSSILERWYHLILDTYPSETAKFFGREKDQFLNPVAYEFREPIGGIYQSLLDGLNSEVSLSLDRIVRIRAVQDFSASQAINFIFLLKKAIREKLEKEIYKNGLFQDWLALEATIDRLALLSFDIYMQCREKIYEIRVNEIKRMTFSLLKRANLLYEIPDFKDNNIDNEVRVNEF